MTPLLDSCEIVAAEPDGAEQLHAAFAESDRGSRWTVEQWRRALSLDTLIIVLARNVAGVILGAVVVERRACLHGPPIGVIQDYFFEETPAALALLDSIAEAPLWKSVLWKSTPCDAEIFRCAGFVIEPISPNEKYPVYRRRRQSFAVRGECRRACVGPFASN